MRNIKKFQNPDGGIFPEDEEYYPIWLDGITVKPSGNRLTTRDDWNWANWREKQNEREQQASESVKRGIDRNGTPIAAGIYGLAAAPFAIDKSCNWSQIIIANRWGYSRCCSIGAIYL